MGIKIKSKEAAVENVKKLFSNSPDKDAISLREAFIAWERPNPDSKEANKSWLSNTMHHLKYHNLVKPVYDYSGGRKRLSKLQLTLEGKKVIGRIDGQDDRGTVKDGNKTTVEDIFDLVAKWRIAHPEFEVKLDVRLKDTNTLQESRY